LGKLPKAFTGHQGLEKGPIPQVEELGQRMGEYN